MIKHNLYVVGTPIGNLSDISKRAIETLASVDCILCEDTRVSEKLLQSIGISGSHRFIIYNDHTASKVINRIITDIKEKDLKFALISDAGMPLISDPGYKLIRACIENDIKYTVIPGASAVLSALILSGMPSDNFMFCGFADSKKLEELLKINTTLIMFESPKRLVNTISEISLFSKDRKIAIVREITKIYEEVIIGDALELIDILENNPPRGEIVIVISPPEENQNDILHEHIELINDLKGKFSDAELSSILARHLKISKNSVYNFIKAL